MSSAQPPISIPSTSTSTSTPQQQQQQPVNISNPQKTGWLEKQSRYLKRWKRRFFALQDSILYSFKDEKSLTSPTEIIDLRIYSSVKSSEDYTHRPYSFDVYSSDTIFSMIASSEQEKEDWIRAIGRAIVVSRTRQWQEDEDDDDS
jgi:hypothetical protein